MTTTPKCQDLANIPVRDLRDMGLMPLDRTCDVAGDTRTAIITYCAMLCRERVVVTTKLSDYNDYQTTDPSPY